MNKLDTDRGSLKKYKFSPSDRITSFYPLSSGHVLFKDDELANTLLNDLIMQLEINRRGKIVDVMDSITDEKLKEIDDEYLKKFKEIQEHVEAIAKGCKFKSSSNNDEYLGKVGFEDKTGPDDNNLADYYNPGDGLERKYDDIRDRLIEEMCYGELGDNDNDGHDEQVRRMNARTALLARGESNKKSSSSNSPVLINDVSRILLGKYILPKYIEIMENIKKSPELHADKELSKLDLYEDAIKQFVKDFGKLYLTRELNRNNHIKLTDTEEFELDEKITKLMKPAINNYQRNIDELIANPAYSVYTKSMANEAINREGNLYQAGGRTW